MKYRKYLFIMCFGCIPFFVEAKTAEILLSSESVLQGEPLLVEIKNIKKTSEIKKMTFLNKEIPVVSLDSKLFAYIGIDLQQKPGSYPLLIEFKRRDSIMKMVTVKERKKYEAPLGIPQKLGGNTNQAAQKVVSNLALENSLLSVLPISKKALFKKSFNFPVSSVFITDPYGYSRNTVSVNITHKGTDFRAPTGTEIFAINDGVVTMSQHMTVYGNTVVIDHGGLIESLYMHLSELKVKVGDKVKRGQVIGYSGSTGYAEAPHLHLSIRINKVSIDPLLFLSFFNLR